MAATLQVRFSAGDRRQQIMEVAKDLFARQGFDGTTTRQIAERAAVNEALIFRHFPTKEDLYWAIIDHQCQIKGGQRALEMRLQSPAGDREIFAAIAEDILRRRAKDTSLTRLLLFSALENHRLSHRFFRTHVEVYYEVLAEHIGKRIRAGVFRRIDPLLAARGFLGMVVYHSLIQEIFGGKRFQQFDVKQVSQTLTDIWIEGMLARNHSSPRRKRR